MGDVYNGKVVNITKFGAFVNILPGRDGLVHISKLGRGKRIDRVEDVVSLGDDIQVRVDDIDPQGKVALSPVGETATRAPRGGGGGGGAESSGGGRPPRQSSDRPAGGGGFGGAPTTAEPAAPGGAEFVSFEDAFEGEAKRVRRPGPGRGGRRRGGGGGDGGPRRNRDRERRRGGGRAVARCRDSRQTA